MEIVKEETAQDRKNRAFEETATMMAKNQSYKKIARQIKKNAKKFLKSPSTYNLEQLSMMGYVLLKKNSLMETGQTNEET